MFEQELELEKKEGSGLGPVIIIIVLIALMAGGLGYFIWDANQVIKSDEAAKLLSTALNSKGPTVVKFHTGRVMSSYEDKVTDPQYGVLIKAGVITSKPDKSKELPTAQVDLTPAGEKLIASIKDVKKVSESDGTTTYTVPLATKELIKVDSVKKLAAKKAQVEYVWRWVPNEMGGYFDAGGPIVKSFNTWDRSVLIDKHGAQFYNADPKKVTIVLVKGPDGWVPSNE